MKTLTRNSRQLDSTRIQKPILEEYKSAEVLLNLEKTWGVRTCPKEFQRGTVLEEEEVNLEKVAVGIPEREKERIDKVSWITSTSLTRAYF